MTERKLINEQDHSTFTRAFEKAARLRTEEDRRVANERSFAELRKELYQPKYEGDSVRDTRRAGNGSGWLNEQPLVNADTDRTNALIEGICNAGLPPRVQIKSLQEIDPAVIRQKLSQAVAQGKITRQQMEEQLALLGLGVLERKVSDG